MKNKELNKKIINYGTNLHQQYPFLGPFMKIIHKIFLPNLKVRFSGWGMKLDTELPWNDEYEGDVFRKASVDIKKFIFNKNATGIGCDNVDILLWRNWIVSFAARYSIEFAPKADFVECGVGDAISAFFVLREICGPKGEEHSLMHLYDSWMEMRDTGLLKSELFHVGHYSELNIETTKKNLEEFKDRVIFHQGYIPDSFNALPNSPDSIKYLHIDLNSANPTLNTLNFFFPKLVKGGVILFDDYGWAGYEDTKAIVDKFFHDKPGILMKIPTGQAIYFR